MMTDRAPGRNALMLAGVALAGYVVLLVTVPFTGGAYDAGTAHLVAAGWTAGVLALTAVLGHPAAAPTSGTPAAVGPTGRRTAAAVALFLAVCALYFPPWLARYGPYVEDHYFLAVMSRMACGQVPYADFEFLYGPLMTGALAGWTGVFGVSMGAYYGLLAVAEGLVFVLLLAVVQRHVPDTRGRLLAFAVLAMLLFNTLLGLNYNGLRRFLPVLALLAVTGGDGWRRHALGGALIGVCLAYSHDFGLAGLLALGGVAGVRLLRGEGLAPAVDGAVMTVAAVAVWAALAGAVMGGAFPDYLEATRAMLGHFGQGIASLRFYWTGHSLVLFALLSLCAVSVGAGLVRRDVRLATGDRFALAALLYTIVAMKSGLNRADFWHMAAAFLPLFFVVLLPMRRVAFPMAPALARAGRMLAIAGAATYLLGGVPTGSYYASGLARGALDVVRGTPAGQASPPATRQPSLQLERTYPNADVLALGAFLAAPDQAARPVFFYGDRWPMPPQVGVCRTDYLVDDFMYMDPERPSSAYLAAHPDAIVVMSAPAYARLFGLAGPDDFPEYDARAMSSPMKRVNSWLVSVHITEVRDELRAKDRLWRDRVGTHLREHYARTGTFGEVVVLEALEESR